MVRYVFIALLLVGIAILIMNLPEPRTFLIFDSKVTHFKESTRAESEGTSWAVLVAGTNGILDYRHQADVCHAYQILKKGGLKDDNIIIMMYDDIAYHQINPRPGTIINHPAGKDVYKGVPKDYTGKAVTARNFLAILLGQKGRLIGGSGKVLENSPNDRIFIYYSGHGQPGGLGMPVRPVIYADDLMRTLEQKFVSKTYRSMVFYVESCYSGSIFKHLPSNIKVYATTASEENELSSGIYCHRSDNIPPEYGLYGICLGDLYSVSWMEDSEGRNLRNYTLKQQFDLVKHLTSPDHPVNIKRSRFYRGKIGSHVQEFGDLSLSSESLALYMGTNPEYDDARFASFKNLLEPSEELFTAVSQDDTDLFFFSQMLLAAPDGSELQLETQRELFRLMEYRMLMDQYMKVIGYFLFGLEKGSEIVKATRRHGEAFVGDWGCFKSLCRVFEDRCAKLSKHIHMLAIANFCNAGIGEKEMIKAVTVACGSGQALEYTSFAV